MALPLLACVSRSAVVGVLQPVYPLEVRWHVGFQLLLLLVVLVLLLLDRADG